jgi:hypothetical protein
MHVSETSLNPHAIALEKDSARICGPFLDPFDLDDLGSSQELLNGFAGLEWKRLPCLILPFKQD